MNMRRCGVLLIFMMMAGNSYQPSLYAAAQTRPVSLEPLKQEYETYHQFFLAEGMFSLGQHDDKRYALFIDSFKRFFDRVKASTSPDHIKHAVRQLKDLYTAYVSAYAKLLIFMIADKECGLQSSQEWSLSMEKKRAVLIAALHNLYNLLFKPTGRITHDDIVQAVLKGIEEQSGRPARPSEVKVKLLRSAQDEVRMYTLRNELLKVDILEYDKESTQRSPFAQKCTDQLLSFIRIEQKYTTYQAHQEGEQGRLLVEEYESFITHARDPLLQLIGRLGSTIATLATKKTWDEQDHRAAFLLSMTTIAQKKITTLTSQWQELHTATVHQEQQEKAYTQARSFGADSFRASAFEQYTRLKSQSDFNAFFNKQTDAVDMRNALERYDTIINRYFEKGTMSEADLGELNFAVSKFALARQKLAQQASSRTLFKSALKHEMHKQIATLDQLTKLSVDVRNACLKGVGMAEHEQLPQAINTVAELLDITTDLIKSDPQFVYYIKEVVTGKTGGLAHLIGHIRSFRSVKNIVRLLSLWGHVERNEILSRVVDVGQEIFKNHLDKIRQISNAFSTQQHVVSTSKDVLEWQQNLESNVVQIKGASFVDSATYNTMLTSIRSVSSFGSVDVGFKVSVDNIMQGYHTLLLAAWRENHALNEKLLQAKPKVVALTPQGTIQTKAPATVKKPSEYSWYRLYDNDPFADLVDNE